MVKRVTSEREFDDCLRTAGGKLVVVDFYGDWCGPCRMIAPFVEELSKKYPDVVFLKVNDQDCPDLMMSRGIRAFPTFHFIIKGNKVDEMRGADAGKLEQMVVKNKASATSTGGGGAAAAFGGQGNVLGGWNGVGTPPIPGASTATTSSSATASAAAAREARLKALEQKYPGSTAGVTSTSTSSSSASTSTATKPAPTASAATTAAMEVDEDDDALIAQAIAASMNVNKAPSTSTTSNTGSTSTSSAATKVGTAADAVEDDDEEDMVPVPVNSELLSQLLEMGFGDARARKGLVHGRGELEGALAWLTEHQDDADIDQPYLVRRADAEAGTSASGVRAAPLTAEEREAKVLALKKKIEERRIEREKLDKVEELKRERERREQGQKLEAISEDRDRMMRRREAERAKKEKEDEKRERERLRAEIARDKELRRVNKGVIPSVLGVDGYANTPAPSTSSSASSAAAPVPAPAAAKAPSSASTARTTATSSTSAAAAAVAVTPEAALKTVESMLERISRYRTGGDGGEALKMLALFVRNVVVNPEEVKYRAINMDSKAFKAKLAPLIGPVHLLQAIGFAKNDEEQKLVNASPNMDLLQSALRLIEAAEKLYAERNS